MNTPMKCLIADDEQIAVKIIAGYIAKVSFLQVEATCSSSAEAASILKSRKIDLMFLDINMPQLSGIEFLGSLDCAPLTILTTAYSEYALEGFRLHAADYLLKPFSFQRFFQAAEKARDLFRSHLLLQKNEEATDIYIRQGDAFRRIQWNEILFVEAMQNYLKLHLTDKTFIIRQTMASIEAMLPREAFFRIHKSFLVNISRIDTISGGRLFLNGTELPISKLRKEELMNTVVYKKLISK